MTEVGTCVKQGAKEYTLTIKTTNYEYYKLIRQLAYILVDSDKKGSMKGKVMAND